jgi:hypothetical protein
MLPPVDEHVLRDNPEFAKLYLILKNDVLNPDGSTKLENENSERETTSQVSKAPGHCALMFLIISVGTFEQPIHIGQLRASTWNSM